MELLIQESWYYSQWDEDAFYDRLARIPCVKSVKGAPDGLHISLRRPPSNLDLREFLALLFRYNLDMTPLAALKTKRNAHWFAENHEAYWHAKVFGKPKKKLRSRRPKLPGR